MLQKIEAQEMGVPNIISVTLDKVVYFALLLKYISH